ncbi:hypothetical protein FKM82_001689 [Ascaphus truei]
MSLQAINDENIINDVTAEPCDFLLTSPQPTGRPSILRLSQKENLPPKIVLKNTKVTFQTPMRDPQTHRLVSPSAASKHEDPLTLDECTQALEQLHLSVSNTLGLNLEEPEKLSNNCINDQPSSYPDEEMPVKSSGSYSIDFGNLGDLNPFESTTQMQNSPLKTDGTFEKDFPSTPDLELCMAKNLSETPLSVANNSCEDVITYSPPHPNSPVTVQVCSESVTVKDCSESDVLNTSGKNTALDDMLPLTESNITEDVMLNPNANNDLGKDLALLETCTTNDNVMDTITNSANGEMSSVEPLRDAEVHNSPPIPKVSYKFDPDQVDSIDPFKMGGSKVQNSPTSGKNSLSEDADVVKAEPVKLEFDFIDGNAPVRKPPPKFGKRPVIKSVPKKPAASQENASEKLKVQSNEKKTEDEIPGPKASYKFDWNTFDDPSFNPFGCGGSKISNSPKNQKTTNDKLSAGEESLPKVESASISLSNNQDDIDQTIVNETCENESVKQPIAFEDKSMISSYLDTEVTDQKVEDTNIIPVCEDMFALIGDGNPFQSDLELTVSNETAFNSNNGFGMEFKPATEIDFTPAEEMEFKSATEVGGFGQPIEIDYLENFGTTSFKESALRKQSLYLKFDPLLRESPKKIAPVNSDSCLGLMSVPMKTCSELFGSLSEASYPIAFVDNEEKLTGLDLLGTVTVSDTAPLMPETSTGRCPQVSSSPLTSDVGSIVEVLKYSQKDMDMAINIVRLEVQEKEIAVLEWKKRHEKLYLEYVEMGKIVAEFEGTITQMIEDSQKQRELTKQEVHKVLQEKEQVQVDLNSMEKSFSELFKRFEKQKDSLEGYRKNEEALKKCVEDYLTRIKKEEQRYQALKAHAEEKLNQANGEIAQVRNKSKSEAAALQATLRKEQMKVQSLDRTIEQMAKENDELTKICDDLIGKMEKN